MSRICLGAMTYGTPARRAWVLDEQEIACLEGPYQPRPEMGHNWLNHESKDGRLVDRRPSQIYDLFPRS